MGSWVAKTYTLGKLQNYCAKALSLRGNRVWKGFSYTDFPRNIMNGDEADFTHAQSECAEEKDALGSKACLLYHLDHGKKWIVAWSNLSQETNKVYTDIVDQHIQYEQIKINLEIRGKQSMDKYRLGYHAHVEIHPAGSDTPMVTAYIEPHHD